MFERYLEDAVERPVHESLQPYVDLFFGPEVTDPVLYPLEVRHRHAPGVAQDVGNDDRPVVGEDGVGLRHHGAVGAFGDDARPHPRRVARQNLVLERGGDEDVDVRVEELVLVERFRLGKIGDRAVLRHVFNQRRYRNPFRVIESPEDV